jgi:polysaccharide pyruvyl transferase WcaK-like protein
MESIGFSTERDCVYPDLAFGLSRQLFTSSVRNHEGLRPVIGVGLKDYRDYDAKGGEAENTYRDYVRIMVDFVGWLCKSGYNVRLLIGDFRYDIRATQDVRNLISKRVTERGRVVFEPAVTVAELVRQLGETDLVISSRYHNLVLAIMLNKPVIALSDHQKLDSLMEGLDLAEYCRHLGTLDLESLIRLFSKLQDNSKTVKAHIRDRSENYRMALDKQYAAAFQTAQT